jgi:hypothetical protein
VGAESLPIGQLRSEVAEPSKQIRHWYRATRRRPARPLRRAVGPRPACLALVASFAAVVCELDLERIAPFHTGALIATFRCDAPPRCGAFVGERRIVVGDEGVLRTRNAHFDSSEDHLQARGISSTRRLVGEP